MRSMQVASFASIVAIAGTLGVAAATQEQAPPSGIYVEAAGGPAEVKLSSARMEVNTSGVGKTMATMGFLKPQMHGVISGPRADTRVAAEVTFRFQLDERAGGGPQNMDLADMMGMMNGGDGAIPPIAKSPNDFFLVKLTVANESREVNFGSVGGSHPKDLVDFAVEKLGPQAFRVKPRHPLAPGEYVFFVHMGGAPMGQAWEFGVDQK